MPSVSHSDRSIFVFLGGFIFAILVSSFVYISPIFSLLSLLVAVIIFISYKIWQGAVPKEVLFIIIFLLTFSLGSLRYAVKDFHEESLPSNTGVVVSEPEKRDSDVRFVLDTDSGNVLVSTNLYNQVNYGDKVQVSGKLEKPMVIDDGTGRPFDYPKYLSKDDIYYTMSFAHVEVLSSGNGNPVKAELLKIKNGFIGKVKEILSEPESSLLAGLIVAGKEAMPKDILEEFRRAGVIHIVVLSGYNLTIIAAFLMALFALFPFLQTIRGKRLSIIFSALAVVLFTLMTGATATVVRAAIMILIVLFGKFLGREYSSPRALLFAAFLMLLENPKILVFDPSFQLSFLAMFALIYVVPIAEKYLPFISLKFGLRTIIATTLATQITVFPYLLYSMGSVSVVSLVSNLLILPLVPFTMLIGFIATLLGFISNFIALPLAFISHLLLAWLLGVSHTLGNLAWASVSISNFPLWLTLVCYGILISFVWREQSSLLCSAS